MQHLIDSSLYSNYIMLAPDGTEMCRCGKKRAEWYLKRNLAEPIPGNPHKFKLKFYPKGNGAADEFGLSEKVNQCVICGTTTHLTKHHIIPSMYRQHFPASFKDRQSHDVLVVCDTDHIRYEMEADKFKKQLEQQFEITPKPKIQQDKTSKRLRVLAGALFRHGDSIPESRKQAIVQELTALTGTEITSQKIQELILLKPEQQDTINEVGKELVNKLLAQGEASLVEFIYMWRQHFLAISQPKFMPKGWDRLKNPKLNT